jgi:hypothetical protein
MIGYVADLGFYFVPDHGIELGLNWRLMMGSAMIPAVIACCFIFVCPESPRWYLTKDRHQDAFDSICRLRFEKVQAARDLFYAYTLLQAEQQAMSIGKRGRIMEIFTVRRNRNAMVASEIVMFMQQFCGTFPFLTLRTPDSNPPRRQRNRLLLLRDLPRGRLLRRQRPCGLVRLRRHQLAVCAPGLLHHRHLWPPQSAAHHLPPHGPLPLLHRL